MTQSRTELLTIVERALRHVNGSKFDFQTFKGPAYVQYNKEAKMYELVVPGSDTPYFTTEFRRNMAEWVVTLAGEGSARAACELIMGGVLSW